MAKAKFPDKQDEVFANSDGANYKQSDPMYDITYRLNGSMEIYVAGQLLKFEAHVRNPVFPEQYQKGVPGAIVNHPDFQSVKKYFTVSENPGG